MAGDVFVADRGGESLHVWHGENPPPEFIGMTAVECATMALAKGIASELTDARTLAWAAGEAVCEARDALDQYAADEGMSAHAWELR